MCRIHSTLLSMAVLTALGLTFSGCGGGEHKHKIPIQQSPITAQPPVKAIFFPTPPPTPGPQELEHAAPPPVKVGRFVRGPVRQIPSSKGGEVDVQRSQPPPGEDPPGDFRFFKNTSVFAGSPSFSTVDEPSLGAADDAGGKAVLYTGNWYAGVSNNGGSSGSFSFMNPFTLFPASAGGFCCDQRAIYDPSRNLFIWLLQYGTTGGCSAATPPVCTGNNIYRIAVSNGPAGLLGGSWCYYDFSPQSLGMPAGLQFDYPHIALSNNFVYFSANSYLSRSVAGTDWRQSSIVRIPLDPLVTCAGYTFSYLNVTDHYDFTLAQGATDTMYFASINSTSSVRIYKWAESSGTIFLFDRNVSSWTAGGSPCTDPGGVDWCSRSGNGGRSSTGWINQNPGRAQGPTAVGFMWNAAACTNRQTCGFNRPFPYVRVLRFDQSNLNLINEPDIWNPSYAFQFPSVGVDARGHLGGTMFWGGGSFFPTLVAFIWDDFTCDPYACGWENYGAVGSTASNANWGDYLDTRRQSPNSNTWVGTGFSYDGSNLTPQFLWFGRDRDTPP